MHRLEKLRRRRDPARRRRASSPRRTKKKTPSWKLASRTTRPPTGWPQRIEALQQGARQPPRMPRPSRGACWPATSRPTPSCPRPSAPPTRPIEIDPRSIPAWTLAARVRESAGSLGDAADALRRLAEIDRRNRTEHLTGIAKLEARLGRIDAALKAGRDLLAAAPGNPENYEFFAQLCFQLGRPEEGLDALRRAVRRQPQRHQDHAHAGRDAGRAVPHRRSHRDVLAGLRQGRRPRRQARAPSAG